MAIFAKGATSVSYPFVLTDSVTHLPKTGVDVTTIDMYYITEHATGGFTLSAKADIVAHAGVNDAYSSGEGAEIGRGWYRIDIPDAVFAGTNGNIAGVLLEASGVDTTFLAIELDPVVGLSDTANLVKMGTQTIPTADLFL